MEKKAGRNRLFIYIVIGMIVLITSGVLAQTAVLKDNVQEIVNNVASKKGIDKEKIENIKEVDFNNLPERVDIENIDDTNLAVYEVTQTEGESFFVITVSDEKLKQYTKEAETHSRMFLNFGSSATLSESGFLETVGGVTTSKYKGYVMVREGSITALSTNLEVVSGSGKIELTIYKNGEEIGFRNSFIVEDKEGVEKDYDSQSFGIVNFEAGDVVSVYARVSGDVSWKDTITLIEITTD